MRCGLFNKRDAVFLNRILIFVVIATCYLLIINLSVGQSNDKNKDVDSNQITPSPTPTIRLILTPMVGVINHGSREKKQVALTFDADMTLFMREKLATGEAVSYYDETIIDQLVNNKVPATLFITGLWAESYPQETKQLAHNPLFVIGNHSYSHPAFARPCFGLPPIEDLQKEEEFQKSQEALTKIIGYTPYYFRFPGGCYKKTDIVMANKYGLSVIGWDVDSEDAFDNDALKIIECVKKEVQPGSIIIFHLTGTKNAPKTAEALPEILKFLKENDYQVIPLDILIDNQQ